MSARTNLLNGNVATQSGKWNTEPSAFDPGIVIDAFVEMTSLRIAFTRRCHDGDLGLVAIDIFM